MGIPSYFSHLIKNNPSILKKLIELKTIPDNLYFDSNSIIYDCLRKIEKENLHLKDSVLETKLINDVCKTLDNYILTISPKKVVYIAFDGVAPFAKMDQQKNRRYKSALDKDIRIGLGLSVNNVWDKTAITPGTNFMKKLSKKLNNYYKTKTSKLGVNKIIISDSSSAGEGEHKIFNYIRRNPQKHKNETTLIYGLDADLIMLCLNHIPLTPKIYLYRETPEFIKSINRSLDPGSSYLMDIPQLATTIINKMNNYKKINKKQQKNRLYDYIFLCFFLGNDFLPHFPAVNIRTSGIDTLIVAYQNTIGRGNQNLTDGKKIFWNNVKKMIDYISKTEELLLKQEYKIRERLEKKKILIKNEADKLYNFSLLPTRNRTKEKMINPYEENWKYRYYKVLFDIDINDSNRKKICVNYLEGLEWTLNYYSDGCLDWKWTYKFNYPPLMSDLIKYIPNWDTTFIKKNNNTSVHPYVQLSYVLSKPSLKLLPNNIQKKLLEKYPEYYKMDKRICWAFCKYFWESHVKFDHININDLETFVMGLING